MAIRYTTTFGKGNEQQTESYLLLAETNLVVRVVGRIIPGRSVGKLVNRILSFRVKNIQK